MQNWLIVHVSSGAALLACTCFLPMQAVPQTGACRLCRPRAVRRTHPVYTYVIIHGAWGGAWDWKDIDHRLRADGHDVYRPTLTGQGERVHLATPDIDLTTHITDVVNVIKFEKLQDIILVGHSYGGMVITGVAEKLADRIKAMKFILMRFCRRMGRA